MTHFVPGNRITLLENGTDYFPALEAALEQAVREVFLETYIFEHDETGKRIVGALKRAAQRGVTVHVLADGFGSKSLSDLVIREMREAGVQFLYYRPELSSWRIRRYRLRRLHRKLVVVDNKIAFVGGINIIDDMDTPDQIPPRYDYAVAVEGPLVSEVLATVRHLWGMVAWSQLRRRRRRRPKLEPAPPPRGDLRAAFLVRDNIRHRRDIENAYLEAIDDAEKEVVIACAYFLPGYNLRRALIEAAARGVRVVLLLQGRVEYILLHYASRALYGIFLDAGIEIYEYHRSFLHAKVAVIDGHWATVGSSNIDPFSLLLSREANVVVENHGFAEELRASLGRAMNEGSRQVLLHGWRQEPAHLRLLSWASYGVVRFLMGAAGYAWENGRVRHR